MLGITNGITGNQGKTLTYAPRRICYIVYGSTPPACHGCCRVSSLSNSADRDVQLGRCRTSITVKVGREGGPCKRWLLIYPSSRFAKLSNNKSKSEEAYTVQDWSIVVWIDNKAVTSELSVNGQKEPSAAE